MTDTLLTPYKAGTANVKNILEEARTAHENYLIKQQEIDLEKAIECYIDAIKADVTEMVKAMKEAMKALAEFVQEMVDWVSAQILDITGAITVVTTRGPKSISSCTVPV